jgi:hypothetical protein
MAGNKLWREMLDIAMSEPLPTVHERLWAEIQKVPGIRAAKVRGGTRFFNCIAYACGIDRFPRLLELVMKHDNSGVVSTGFMQHLIDIGEVSVKPSFEFVAGDVVVYFNGDKLTHGARALSPDLLRSKWGGNELIEHALWHVPTSYGDSYRVVSVPDPERIMELFEAWLAVEGSGHA